MAGHRDLLKVDLLFSGTTSTYFELDSEDEPVPRDKNGNVTRDAQKAAEDKPAPFRVVIGMAATRDGIPGPRLVLAGQDRRLSADPPGQNDLRDWTLSRIVWIANRGFTSADNRRYLRSGDQHYILGEKLRSGSAEAQAAWSRQDAAGNDEEDREQSPAACGCRHRPLQHLADAKRSSSGSGPGSAQNDESRAVSAVTQRLGQRADAPARPARDQPDRARPATPRQPAARPLLARARRAGFGQSFWVEILLATALCSAVISASIHVW